MADTEKQTPILLFWLGQEQAGLAYYQTSPLRLDKYWLRRDDFSADNLLPALTALWRETNDFFAQQKDIATVFLVSPFWVKADGSLLEGKKELLLKVAHQYHLKPLGFLLGDEALIHYFRQQRGQVPSFIGVNLSQPLEVSLVHLGKVKSRLRLEMKEWSQFPSAIEKALGQLDYPGMFPPHFVFWGAEKATLKQLETVCNRYPWVGRRDSLFLQIPQFTFLDWPHFLAAFLGILAERFHQEKASEDNNFPLAAVAEEKREKEIEEVSATEKKGDQPPSKLPAGFSHQDLSLGKDEVEEKGNEPPLAVASSPLGESNVQEEVVVIPRTKIWSRFLTVWRTKLPPKKINVPSLFVFFHFDRGRFSWPLLAGALFLLALLVLNAYFLPVDVIVKMTPQTLTFRQKVTAAALALQPLTSELEAEGSVAVSGKKTVGEKALGTVTIFNRLSRPLLLASGTKLEAANGLTFRLRESVKVASRTADLNQGVDKLGQTQAAVIASQIGPEYNLKQGTTFKVDDYSRDECLARAGDDFSGGSNRQVSAVGKKDLDALKKQLLAKINQQALPVLTAKAGAEKEIINQQITPKIVAFQPSRHLGEEATSLEGHLKVELKAFVVDRQHLHDLALQLARKKLPAHYLLAVDQLHFQLTPEASNSFRLRGEAVIYPQLAREQIRRQLRARTKAGAQLLLHHYPRVGQVTIHRHPGLFNFWPWLPLRAKQIKVIIRPN